LADLILLIHFGFVAFVVLGFVVIWIGYFRRWNFVRNIWFRVAHLAAMGYVALEAIAGLTCPLTAWEARLRVIAGQADRYEGSFIQHWVHRFIFFDVPEWIFTVVYLGFFALLLLTFWIVRPRRKPRSFSVS
jgi:hypothetical protein